MKCDILIVNVKPMYAERNDLSWLKENYSVTIFLLSVNTVTMAAALKTEIWFSARSAVWLRLISAAPSISTLPLRESPLNSYIFPVTSTNKNYQENKKPRRNRMNGDKEVFTNTI